MSKMRQWKIALSLAIIGAVAAPLVLRTHQARPQVSGFLPLTAERREEITAYLAGPNYCKEFEEIPIDKLRREADECIEWRGLLRDGEHYSHFSVPKYIVLNIGVAVLAFAGIFSLAMVLRELIRR
jgi:hypothetical protein